MSVYLQMKKPSKMYILAAIYLYLDVVNAHANLNVQKITCGGIIFNHVYYEKQFIVCKLGRPYNLMYHKFSNQIYFSHTVQKNTEVDFEIMSCHLETKKCENIKGVPGGYALAYDSGNDDIFMGGHDGIYKYNFMTKKAEFFSEEGKSIWSIFVRKNFYYIEYPTQRLHVYRRNKFIPVAEAMRVEIDQFFISRLGDIYFANKTALFKVPKLKKEPIVLNDDLAIRQIAEDFYGDVYFCANDGIYTEEKIGHTVKKIADIDQAFGLAFDKNDHVVYSDKDCIYRLVSSENTETCYNALKTNNEIETRRRMISNRA